MNSGKRLGLAIVAAATVAASLLVFAPAGSSSEGAAVASETPVKTQTDVAEVAPAETRTATFAAGCFWGVEETYRTMEGVVATRVGYTGGHEDNPSYKRVCRDVTGHAEAVEVTYDPTKVTYNELLEVFWKSHNPTTPNRQGVDFGSQYRSGIFYHSPEQKEIAQKSKQALADSGKWLDYPIVTEITEASTFWPAEDYHQKYLFKRGMDNCH